MSAKFKCWDVEDTDLAATLTAYDARAAAELFIEKNWTAVDNRGCYEVDVEAADGSTQRFSVMVEAQPVFVATPLRRRPPTNQEPTNDAEK